MFKSILYFLITGLCTINGLENVQIFLKDYITSLPSPPKIDAYLCWETEYSFQLMKLLWSENLFIRTLNTCDEITNKKDEEILSILDLSCPFAKDCLDKAETVKFFKPPYKWILLDKNLANFKEDYVSSKTDSTQMEIFQERDLNLFTNISILIDSDVLYAYKENDTTINMEKVYKRKSYLEIILEKYGYWVLGEGIFQKQNINKIQSRRRQNLQKTPISAYIVIFDNDTMNHLDDFKNKGVDTFIKANYVITAHLLDFMNSTHVYVFGRTWGYKAADGTYNGMMGAIQKGEVDMSGSVLLPSMERIQYVEFLTMTTSTEAVIIFRQPPLSTVKNIFILSFSGTVWLGIGLLIGISILLLYIIFSWEKIKYSIDEKSRDVSTADGFFDTVLMTMGAVSQQGTVIEARSMSGRTATLLMFTSFMFLYTSYSANIVSLIQSDSKSITSLSDLLHSKIKLASQDVPYFRYFLPLETGKVKERIWEEKMHTKGKPNFIPPEEGIERTRKEFFAFHVETGVGYNLVAEIYNEDEKCGLTELKFLSFTGPYYVCPRKSELREILKLGLIKIHESGLQKRINDKLYTKKPVCSGKGSNFVSVGLYEMTPPLIWLGIGQAIALILLMFEKLIPYFQC